MTNEGLKEPFIDSEYSFKIVLIGDKMVGKTSLITRFVFDKFQGRYMGTIGLNVSTKNITIDINNNKYLVHLVIYDLASEETFEDLFEPFSRGASGAIFVFDLTRKNTLESIEDWRIRLQKLTEGAINTNIYLIGNKLDLKELREIKDEGQMYAKEHNMINYIETSAKDNLNIDEAFKEITQKILFDAIKNN